MCDCASSVAVTYVAAVTSEGTVNIYSWVKQQMCQRHFVVFADKGILSLKKQMWNVLCLKAASDMSKDGRKQKGSWLNESDLLIWAKNAGQVKWESEHFDVIIPGMENIYRHLQEY